MLTPDAVADSAGTAGQTGRPCSATNSRLSASQSPAGPAASAERGCTPAQQARLSSSAQSWLLNRRTSDGSFGKQPVHVSAAAGDVQGINEIIKSSATELSVQDLYGCGTTPLCTTRTVFYSWIYFSISFPRTPGTRRCIGPARPAMLRSHGRCWRLGLRPACRVSWASCPCTSQPAPAS